MKKYLKIIGITIAAIILFLLIAQTILNIVINPNRYKNQISQLVKQKTGQQLTIANIRWSLFPWIGLRANDITYGKTAKIKKIDVDFQLLPLISKKLNIGELALKDVVISLPNYTLDIDVKSKIRADLAKNIYNLTKLKAYGYIVPLGYKRKIKFNFNSNQAVVRDMILSAPDIKATLNGTTFEGNIGRFDLKTGILNSNITINKLHFRKPPVHFTDISAQININKNIINLSPVMANLYNGAISGRLGINTGTTGINSTVRLNNVQIQPLFDALINNRSLSGRVNLNTNLTTSGQNSAAMVKNLNGSGTINIVNGTLRGIDIGQIINTVQARLQKRAGPGGAAIPRTRFSKFSATFTIRNGVLSSNDLTVTGKDFQLTGKGTVNLVSERINTQIRAASIFMTTRNGQQVKQKQQIIVPINVTGPLDNPKFSPDFAHVLLILPGKVVETSIETGVEVTKGVGKIITAPFRIFFGPKK